MIATKALAPARLVISSRHQHAFIHSMRRRKVRIPKQSPQLMPPPTDPHFYAGRTALVRAEEHYYNTLAPDLMVLTYRHKTQAMAKAEVQERLAQKEQDEAAAAAELANP